MLPGHNDSFAMSNVQRICRDGHSGSYRLSLQAKLAQMQRRKVWSKIDRRSEDGLYAVILVALVMLGVEFGFSGLRCGQEGVSNRVHRGTREVKLLEIYNVRIGVPDKCRVGSTSLFEDGDHAVTC